MRDKHHRKRALHQVKKKVQHLLVPQQQLHDILHNHPTKRQPQLNLNGQERHLQFKAQLAHHQETPQRFKKTRSQPITQTVLRRSGTACRRCSQRHGSLSLDMYSPCNVKKRCCRGRSGIRRGFNHKGGCCCGDYSGDNTSNNSLDYCPAP